MDAFESAVYGLMAGKTAAKELEQWVYSELALEYRLNPEDYLDLIAMDYRLPGALYEADKILRRYVSIGGFHAWRLRHVLERVLNRFPDVHEDLAKCYDLYCDGFYFLEDLGLRFGLMVVVPPSNFSADSWEELSAEEQQRLIGFLYPGAAMAAAEAIRWLDEGGVVITGEDADGRVLYEDRRGGMIR